MEQRVELAVQQQREREYRSRVLSQCGSLYLVFEYVEHDLGGLIDAKYQVRACASLFSGAVKHVLCTAH